MPVLPTPRGPLSGLLAEHLPEAPGPLPAIDVAAPDPIADEDLQLALYCCYELHYRGFDGVDPAWEWEPSLLELRRRMERPFEAAVRELAGPGDPPPAPEEMDLALRAIADADDGPSLSRFVERHATAEQLEEFLVLRSAYQLKEADPHTFALPRIAGPAKAAFADIQADEYGGGRPERVHQALYAKTLAAVGLDTTYGAHLDRTPGHVLASTNLMSLFGLHRRLRGAAVGHLALFEMTSAIPSGRYARGLRRLGLGDDAADFFDEHVLADAVHEHVAAVDLAGGLARSEPELAADVLFGARALTAVDGRSGAAIMAAWEAGEPATRPAADAVRSAR